MKYCILISFIWLLKLPALSQSDKKLVDLNQYLSFESSCKVFKSDFVDRQSGDSLLFIDTLLMVHANFRQSNYYFTKNKSDTLFLDISLSYFLYGLVGFDKSSLVYAEVFDEGSLKNIRRKSFKPICPRFVELEKSYDYDAGWFSDWAKISFKEVEKIQMFNGQKENCLVAILESGNEHGKHQDSVWLAKNYGVVKWIRGTGRKEVLIDILDCELQTTYIRRKKYH